MGVFTGGDESLVGEGDDLLEAGVVDALVGELVYGFLGFAAFPGGVAHARGGGGEFVAGVAEAGISVAVNIGVDVVGV